MLQQAFSHSILIRSFKFASKFTRVVLPLYSSSHHHQFIAPLPAHHNGLHIASRDHLKPVYATGKFCYLLALPCIY